MTTLEKKYILNQAVAEQKMRRMALEIIENNSDEKEIILAGIRESGTVVAACIQQMLAAIQDCDLLLMFSIIDGRTSGKDIAKLVWFINEVKKYRSTRVDVSWVDPL